MAMRRSSHFSEYISHRPYLGQTQRQWVDARELLGIRELARGVGTESWHREFGDGSRPISNADKVFPSVLLGRCGGPKYAANKQFFLAGRSLQVEVRVHNCEEVVLPRRPSYAAIRAELLRRGKARFEKARVPPRDTQCDSRIQMAIVAMDGGVVSTQVGGE
jgi:hypothetical protein